MSKTRRKTDVKRTRKKSISKDEREFAQAVDYVFGRMEDKRQQEPYRWRTADGRELLVGEMANEHIASVIEFLWDRIRASIEPSRIEQHAIALQHMIREQKRRLYKYQEHAHPRTFKGEVAIIMFTREEVLALADNAPFAYTLPALEHNAFSAAMRKVEHKAKELRRT